MSHQLLMSSLHFCRARLWTQRLSPARTRACCWSRRLRFSPSSTRPRLRWLRAATLPCRTPASTPWGSALATLPCACSPGLACGPPASSRASPTSCGSSCSTDSRHSRYGTSHAASAHSGCPACMLRAVWFHLQAIMRFSGTAPFTFSVLDLSFFLQLSLILSIILHNIVHSI